MIDDLHVIKKYKLSKNNFYSAETYLLSEGFKWWYKIKDNRIYYNITNDVYVKEFIYIFLWSDKDLTVSDYDSSWNSNLKQIYNLDRILKLKQLC